MSRSFIFILLFSFIEALAGPVHMTYQGRLFDSSGDPVENGTVSIVTQVMDPLADCLLYEETHSVDMSQSSGFFSIQIGAGTQNTSTAPNFTLSESLSNAAAFNDVLLGCTGDSYTPGATDKRILRVSIDGNTLNPDQPINSTPYSLFANEATNLGGKPLSQVESEYQSYADSNWAGTPLPDIQSTPLTAGDSFKWDGTKWIVFQPGSATGLTDVLGGTGLTDTGTTTKTLNIGAGNGITVNADDIAVDAGDGLQFNSGALEVNLGAGLQINAGAIEVNQSAINYSSISGTPAAATTLVDGLMSSGDKSKLDNIAANAEVNVNADWNASSGDAQIMNKPAIPSNITDLTVGNDSISGNAVNGGTISSFASTGIDDNAAATAMTIDGSGNVGVGTATPNSTLEVEGYIQLDVNSSAPASADCDAATEYGRMRVDADSGDNVLYICTADGWQSFSPGSGGGGSAPTGAIQAFAQTSCPTGWIAADGSAVSRTTYSGLFTALSTNYGVGDGSTTFNLPDYRGQFLRGFDNGAGADPDAAARTDRGDGATGDAVGTKQSFAMQNVTGHFGSGNGMRFNNVSGPFSLSTSTSSGAATAGNSGNRTVNFDLSSSAQTSTETRPRNVSVLYCIKE